ncbi:MAG: hypothetical protein WCK46_02495 [Candidatus Adlerbacteria bacterium]
MNAALPRKVRRAISNIKAIVNHETVWSRFTQTVFPGECLWKVTGGNDWPTELAETPVFLCATRYDGIAVIGMKEVGDLLIIRRKQIEGYDYGVRDYASVANEKEALEEVYKVLLAAQACNEEEAAKKAAKG